MLSQKLLAALMLSYVAVASITAVLITPALPELAHSYHATNAAITYVINVYLVGYTLGLICYGPLANYCGRVRTLRLGLLINVIGVSLCLLSLLNNNYNVLLLGRFISALGASAGLVCSFILINEYFTITQAKTILAYVIIVFSLSIGLAVFFGGLLTYYFAWPACFIALLFYGILILLLSLFLPETLALQQRQSLQLRSILAQYQLAFRQKDFVVFSLIVGSASVFSYTYATAGAIIAKHFLHLSALLYGNWNSLTIIGMLGGGLSARYLLQRYTNLRVILFGLILFALGLASFAIQIWLMITSPLLFFLITSLCFFASGCLYSGAAIQASTMLSDKAAASAAMNFVNMSSAIVALLLLTVLPFTFFLDFLLINAAYCLMLALFLCLLRFNTKHTARQIFLRLFTIWHAKR